LALGGRFDAVRCPGACPRIAIALVLAAAVCHSTWNLIGKKSGGGNLFVLMRSMLVCVVWLPVVV